MVRLKEVEEEIKQYDKIVVVSHFSPEADAIGSQLAVGRILKRMGKQIILVNQDPLPPNLEFLKGTSHIKFPQEVSSEIKEAEACIVLDCGSLDRVGRKVYELIKDLPIINIDHHADNPGYGYVNYIQDVPATAQIVYRLIQYMGFNIDPPLATALYAGIMADTNAFCNENTTAEVMEISADLITQGATARQVAVNLFEKTPFKKQKLLGEALTAAKFEGKVVWSMISQDLLDRTDTSMKDTEGILNQLRATEGAEIAVLLKELKDEKVKVSLRSKGETDVSKIARSFGGGGHKGAAGCVIEGSLEKVEEDTIKLIKDKVKDL